MLLDTLFKGLRGYMALFSALARKDRRTGADRLVATHTAYFAYPHEVRKALVYAGRASAEAREVRLCPHLLVRKRRLKENAANIQALWADETELPEGFPEPTISVQSSPGKRHLYWALRRVLAPGDAEKLSWRLTHTIGADTGG